MRCFKGRRYFLLQRDDDGLFALFESIGTCAN